MMETRNKFSFIVKTIVILIFTFLIMPSGTLWAKISDIRCTKCDGVCKVHPGGSVEIIIQGQGVDFARSVTFSNPALTATIPQRWNGAQNANEAGGNIAWGRIKILVRASSSAPVGTHNGYINYPLGPRDTFQIVVIAKAGVTGHTVLTPLTQPFSGPVDVKLTGTGLKKASASVRFIRDAYTKLLDSSGQEVPTLTNQMYYYVQGLVNSSTNTDTQVDVRLTFSNLPRLTKATIEIVLTSSDGCSGLSGSSQTHRVTLEAPIGGPNYVASHNYCVPNQPCTTTFMLNATICVTIRLDRPVPGRCLAVMDRLTGKVKPCGEIVYWTVSDRSAIKSDGATPYNPLALNNTIWIPNGQQEKRICFIGIKGSREGITSKFITWKPDPNNDTFPNRRESSFTIKSQ